MTISIVVPTFNRDRVLAEAIASFATQNFPADRFEILVIDNSSTDNTRQVVESAIAAHPQHNIRYIYEPEPGLLSGRHRGALEAAGDILTFVDDDILADSNWLAAISTSFDDSSIQLVGGRNLPKYEIDPPEWLEYFWNECEYGYICGELSLLDFGDRATEIDANYVWGLNFSIRKEALFALGGFHPDCIPKHLQHFQGDGETGLTRKANQLGYKAIYQPEALIFHQISKSRMTYEYFDRRYFYQGVCNSYTDIRADTSNLENMKAKALKEIFKAPLRAIKQRILLFKGKLTIEAVLMQKLYRRFERSLIKGYKFHHMFVYKHPRLLEWVLKEDYWDYKLPELKHHG